MIPALDSILCKCRGGELLERDWLHLALPLHSAHKSIKDAQVQAKRGEHTLDEASSIAIQMERIGFSSYQLHKSLFCLETKRYVSACVDRAHMV